MRFGEVLKRARVDLAISRRHDEWLAEHPNVSYTEEALEFMQRELSKPQRVREGSISASSLHTCFRKQQFTYLGLPEKPLGAKTTSIFHNGTYTHLRWQMAGLSAGWLVEAEVPVRENEYGLSGTMDGVCDDDSVLEIKSINSRGFANVVSFGAKEEHKTQLATYMLATGRKLGRFIYENKDTQEYREIPYEVDEERLAMVEKNSDHLWTELGAKRLAEPLESCMAGTGSQFNYCPFNDRCLAIKGWEDAVELAHGR